VWGGGVFIGAGGGRPFLQQVVDMDMHRGGRPEGMVVLWGGEGDDQGGALSVL
jgi:hypothetical protein